MKKFMKDTSWALLGMLMGCVAIPGFFISYTTSYKFDFYVYGFITIGIIGLVMIGLGFIVGKTYADEQKEKLT